MIDYEDIRIVHIEISSECNAECPLCPRNFHGYSWNRGYPEHSMTLAEAKKIFTPSFLNQLDEILINGNFGDIVMCPEAIDIIQYFRKHNKQAPIHISTNAGARNTRFWQELASFNCTTYFCIDGLEDTHSLYRRNTLFSTVIKNAQTYIDHGGSKAIWKFIVFDHNQHQIEQARALSEQMGFDEFEVIYHGRTSGPVFDNNKKLLYYLGTNNSPTAFDDLVRQTHENMSLERLSPIKGTQINCKAKARKEVYISSIGEVYPCCWLGFHPMTYGQGSHFEVTNMQLKPLIHDNNALIHGLKKSIQWFNSVERSWSSTSLQTGRLHACDQTCG